MPISDYGQMSLLQASRLPENMQRKIYSDLRSVANKRLDRLGKSEFSSTQTYKYHKGGFPKLSDISKKDLSHQLSDLTKFVYSNTTVSGMRAEAKRGAEEFQSKKYHGIFDFVTPQNYFQVIEMLDYYHRMGYDRLYDSERVVTLANEVKSKFTDQLDVYNHFEFWIDHADELSVLRTTKQGRSTGSAIQWRNALGISRYDD